MNAPHHYERCFAAGDGSSLAWIAEAVAADSKVLELGPGPGMLAQHLRERGGCTIDAVELDPQMADSARPWCRQVVVGNLETLRLDATLESPGYDSIVAADVLEHLRDPGTVLDQLACLLKPAGQLLVSVPNVAYAGLIGALLANRFDYDDEGLLDRTHLRFFTRRSLDAFLREHGFFAWEWHAVLKPLHESEFRTRLETLPAPLASLLESTPQALVYQWVVAARREPPPQAPAEPEWWASDRFPLRVFWAEADFGFSFENSVVAWGEVGTERQTMTVPLPEGIAPGRLRISLADRASYLRLYGLRLVDVEGKPKAAWSWSDGAESLSSATSDLALTDAHDHVLATLYGNESWLELAGFPAVGGATLILDLGWPMSADYLAARRGWQLEVPSLNKEIDRLRALVQERDVALELRTAQTSERERLIVERDATIELRNNQLREREQRIAERDALLDLRNQQMRECEQLVAERDAMLELRNRQMQEREQLIAERDAMLDKRNAQMQEREQLIAERDAQLERCNGELAAREALIAAMRSPAWWVRKAWGKVFGDSTERR